MLYNSHASKSEYRNPKSETNPKSKIQMTKTVICFEFVIYVIRACFEFRASNFEFYIRTLKPSQFEGL